MVSSRRAKTKIGNGQERNAWTQTTPKMQWSPSTKGFVGIKINRKDSTLFSFQIWRLTKPSKQRGRWKILVPY